MMYAAMNSEVAACDDDGCCYYYDTGISLPGGNRQGLPQPEEQVSGRLIQHPCKRTGAGRLMRSPARGKQLRAKQSSTEQKSGKAVWSKLTLVPAMRAHISLGASAAERVVS
jgi:hypothetical protein